MVRLATRLAKLELVASTDSLSADAQKLLVSLLGRRDALFFPTRTNNSRVGIFQRQRAYLNGSDGISARADGQGQWKDAHYARAELQGRRMVTANSSSGQVTSMFLTVAGDTLAKSLVWDCPQQQSLNEVHKALFLRLQQFDKNRWCGFKWVSESELFDRSCTGNPDDWIELTSMVLPLLVAGLVVSNNDNYGRLYYCTNEVDFPTIEDIEYPALANQAFTDAYLAAYHAERRALETAKPLDDSEIVIPIPCSGW